MLNSNGNRLRIWVRASGRPIFAAVLLVLLVLGTGAVAAEDPPAQSKDQDAKDGVQRARSCVLKVECLDKLGSAAPAILSAVAIDEEGHLLTVGLPAPAEQRLCVRDCSGKRFEARWIAIDERSGLTMLKVDPGVVRAPEMINKLPDIGSAVIVVGNPFGLSHSVSVGNISGLDRTVSLAGGVGRGLIQFTAPVFPGDSGGLLADRNGRMLGIVSTALGEPTSDSGPERRVAGIGFAIPAQDVRLVAQWLREGRKVERGYLGVTAVDAEPTGVRVTSVAEGSPAQSAGIQVGDVIAAIDGDEVTDFDHMAGHIERLRPDSQVALKIKREGEDQVLQVKLGERKPTVPISRRPPIAAWTERLLKPGTDAAGRVSDDPVQQSKNWIAFFSTERGLLGVQTQPLTESLAKSLGLTSTDGALVSSLVPGSPAERARLRPSDLIVELNDQPLKTPAQLRESIQVAGPGAKIKLGIVRDGKREKIDVILAPGSAGSAGEDPSLWLRNSRALMFPDKNSQRVDALEERIRGLEKRLEELEKQLDAAGKRGSPTEQKR